MTDFGLVAGRRAGISLPPLIRVRECVNNNSYAAASVGSQDFVRGENVEKKKPTVRVSEKLEQPGEENDFAHSHPSLFLTGNKAYPAQADNNHNH